jgi:hypothetical protein
MIGLDLSRMPVLIDDSISPGRKKVPAKAGLKEALCWQPISSIAASVRKKLGAFSFIAFPFARGVAAIDLTDTLPNRGSGFGLMHLSISGQGQGLIDCRTVVV